MDPIDTIYEEGRAAAVAALEAAAERLRLRLAELEVEIAELQDGQPVAEPPEPWDYAGIADEISNTYEGVARSTAPPALDDKTVTVSPIIQNLQPNPMQAGVDAALARYDARPRARSGEATPINPMRLAASEPAWAAKSEVHR